MSCRGCASKFSLFSKEQSCQACAFSYCSKCLGFKAVIPEKGPKAVKVCGSCMQKFTNKNTPAEAMEPPALLIKRLENLENPGRPPITAVFNKGRKLAELKRGLSAEDTEIVERLEKLRADRAVTMPSDDELKERLAMLQGRDVAAQQKSNLPSTDTRSEQEKVDDLLQRYMEETHLDDDHAMDTDHSIEARLNALRGPGAGERKEEKMDSDSDDEATAAAKLVQQVLDEAEMDQRSSLLGTAQPSGIQVPTSTDDWEASESELPWCTICNEDASLRCLGCEGDLYCSRCLKETHDTFDIKHHKTIPFKPDNKTQAT